ncbi:hypothetical protein NSZ01_01400 [Nocardioides szechwanensis]|uniref:Uncharacterized protein n=1 Tax=Nocardioides szechwanensis TaxID=1005944 RepID=A0A1G9XBU6_9ACTN|nr:hypothetical protein [Nocardioides szechwanensis]GEP32372.1 hypothetical protein NSZ01_01400 [Nocardioides szechwanensis]SDM93916.1 hypothetical protein SAMN05192576_1314 [Nocardioides szechwanensis]
MPTERSKPRLPATVVLAVAAGLLAVGVAVWGATHQPSSEEPGGSPQETTTATPEPSPRPSDEPPVDARSRLRDALARWEDADTGSFTQTSVIPGVGTLTLTGVYRLSTRSSDATQVFAADEGDVEPVEVRFLGSQGATYLNSPAWGPELRTCWMRFDALALANASGVALANGASSLPANVVALSHARATRVDPTDPEVVVGTVPLTDAAPLFGSGLVRALRDTPLDALVAAEFRLVAGEVVGWRIEGDSMVAALESALATPTESVLAAVASYDVEVEYEGVGATEVDVLLPARELRMTQAQAQSGVGCRP